MDIRIRNFEHVFKYIQQPHEVDNGWSVSLRIGTQKHLKKQYTLTYWGVDRDFPNPFKIQLYRENGPFEFDTGDEWTLMQNAWRWTKRNED